MIEGLLNLGAEAIYLLCSPSLEVSRQRRDVIADSKVYGSSRIAIKSKYFTIRPATDTTIYRMRRSVIFRPLCIKTYRFYERITRVRSNILINLGFNCIDFFFLLPVVTSTRTAGKTFVCMLCADRYFNGPPPPCWPSVKITKTSTRPLVNSTRSFTEFPLLRLYFSKTKKCVPTFYGSQYNGLYHNISA